MDCYVLAHTACHHNPKPHIVSCQHTAALPHLASASLSSLRQTSTASHKSVTSDQFQTPWLANTIALASSSLLCYLFCWRPVNLLSIYWNISHTGGPIWCSWRIALCLQLQHLGHSNLLCSPFSSLTCSSIQIIFVLWYILDSMGQQPCSTLVLEWGQCPRVMERGFNQPAFIPVTMIRNLENLNAIFQIGSCKL